MEIKFDLQKDALYSSLSAAVFPLLRYGFTKFMFEPIGRKYLPQPKKNDAPAPASEYQQKLQKWNESCWKIAVFSLFTVMEVITAWGEPWLTDSRFFWLGCTSFPPCSYPMSGRVYVLYMVMIGFYAYSVPALLCWEARRKDFYATLGHHIVTLILLLYSYSVNFVRVGALVMLLHDVNDIFMDTAKLYRYLDNEFWMYVYFALFVLSWFITRVFIFPIYVIRSSLYEPLPLAELYGIESVEPHYSLFNGMLIFLWLLHVYWSWLIVKVIVRQLGGKGVDDIREEEDD